MKKAKFNTTRRKLSKIKDEPKNTVNIISKYFIYLCWVWR